LYLIFNIGAMKFTSSTTKGIARLIILLVLIIVSSCCEKENTKIPTWVPYDQAALIAENADHPSERVQYKLIQSRFSDKNELWAQIEPQLSDFNVKDYDALKPFILERSITDIQKAVADKRLTYKQLTQWYLYRIVLFENDSATALNNIISVNPKAVEQAEQLDQHIKDKSHPIYGMPILLKDNINTEVLPTTAGAVVFADNITGDAFIADRIQEKGGIILGKANLSEWANFLCTVCPNGYSAVGGQTLNPYGPRKFDTGGSSSGSGSAVAANYAVAAVGTETSGSILSPSSSNSIVGLKPTVGLLSRGGIVPISSTLDTPGPMTKTVADNAILLSAMVGNDPLDEITMASDASIDYTAILNEKSLTGLRFGAIKNFMEDSLYQLALEDLENLGAEIIEIEPKPYQLEGFLTLLNADMKADLPAYIKNYGNPNLTVANIQEIMAYNLNDTIVRIPYGQGRFEGVAEDSTKLDSLEILKQRLMTEGKKYFSEPMEKNKLDGILSINNWSAGYAAVAHYPCLTVPMGYDEGQPKGLTFVAKPFEEAKLLKWGNIYEEASHKRKVPENYQ
jgi:amidase